MMYALVAPVLVFGGGAAIDYGRAAQIHTKLNAAADAAALAALTPAMLQQSATVAQAASVSMFNGLTEGIPGLTAHATQVTVTITVGATSLTRNVAVSLHKLGQHHLRPGARQERVAGCGRLGGERAGAAQYRLLRPARQFALDGSASDGGRHHQNGKPRRRRKRPAAAPSPAITCRTNANTDTKGNPCVDGTTPTLSAPPPSTSKGNSYCDDRSTAGRSTTTSSPATTASRFVWTN